MKKEVTICDGCGKVLEKPSEIYHLRLESDRFWDGVETTNKVIYLDFCYVCAKKIKETLEKIAERCCKNEDIKKEV